MSEIYLPHSNCITDYCYYGHSFVWHSADTRAQFVPNGTHCQCGKMIADGKGGYENAGSKSYP